MHCIPSSLLFNMDGTRVSVSEKREPVAGETKHGALYKLISHERAATHV
jgi:hypothetical protein